MMHHQQHQYECISRQPRKDLLCDGCMGEGCLSVCSLYYAIGTTSQHDLPQPRPQGSSCCTHRFADERFHTLNTHARGKESFCKCLGEDSESGNCNIQNPLTMLRIRTTTSEIIVTPDDEFFLIALQRTSHAEVG